jgi:beta-glucanase (GH16 family)
MGVHAFRDPRLEEAFAPEELAVDAREPHVYAAEWTPERVAFSVDGEHVKTVGQSPDYPMQLMLNVYELPGRSGDRPYPKVFHVDWVRGHRMA